MGRIKDKKIADSLKAPEREDVGLDDLEYDENGDLVPKKYVGTMIRNPHGANSGLPDPRQELLWKFYLDGLAKGLPNATKAALDAGYAPTTAHSITNLKWFKERKAKLGRRSMLAHAERNLRAMLKMDWKDIKLVEVGKDDDGKPVMEEKEELNIDKAKLVKDVSIFIAETLGKDDGYSKKVEESKNVKHDIQIESISYADAQEIPASAQEVIKEAIVEEIINE